MDWRALSGRRPPDSVSDCIVEQVFHGAGGDAIGGHGEIRLDAPVQAYLPDFTLADPALAAQITIRQLFNQTSGLGDAGFPETRRAQPNTLAERITSLRDAYPIAQPGALCQYYNVNYQILARVVEVVSGQTFSQYLQKHIFTPLLMSDTLSTLTSAEAEARANNLAQGHLNLFGFSVFSREERGFFGGSGSVVSTAADMANYLKTHSGLVEKIV